MKRKKRKKKTPFGRCPVAGCNSLDVLTRHHFLPIRFFGDNPFYIKICSRCHQRVERIIPLTERLTKGEYLKIAYNFVKGR